LTGSFNYNAVKRMVGVAFLIVGLAMFPALIVAFIYSEHKQALCFAYVMIPAILFGIICLVIFPPDNLKVKQRDGYLIVTLFWLIGSAVGAIPMVLTGAMPNPVDAFFEMCSGFSTTGATVLTDIEEHSRSVLFWRSFTHWMGGMGIVCFATALLPSIGIGGQTVASAEMPGPTLSKLTARFSDTTRYLYALYIGFTVAEVIMLLFGGLSLYDALIHTFGTVGTGGFSSYSDSIGHFKSPYVEWVIIVFMIMCGINFNLYFYFPRKRIKKFFRDEELRLYISIIVVFSFISAIFLMIQGGYTNWGRAIRDAFFQISSIITTTGYATANFDMWPSLCKTLILIVTITGACASSTGGGLKIIRVLTSMKFIKHGVLGKIHPSRVDNIKVNGQIVAPSVITDIVNFVLFYIIILFSGVVLISFDGFDFVTNFTAALTCLNNVGPGLAGVGPNMNFAAFSSFSKLILSFTMIAGRLELYTFFMMFSPHFWNSNKA
jgi:trk system potassium uptake protein TrkH